MSVRTWIGPVALVAGLSPVMTAADDGVLEINQAAALAGGVTEDAQIGCVDLAGFPVTLCTPGSYILTSDLSVPASASGIRLWADEVNLDLNGFRITGPATCNASACPSSSGGGVERDFIPPASLGGSRGSVSNGTVRGFASNCVSLGQLAHVERLLVSECGATGIRVGPNSIVTQNRVSSVGLEGIHMSGPAGVITHNIIADASLQAGQGSVSISAGFPTAGNSCDDGSCSAVRLRRYYLTDIDAGEVFAGDQALGGCANGFHMASLWEIFRPSSLQYDPLLGATRPDSGSGPPSNIGGWIRTGLNEENQVSSTSPPNCDAWTIGTGASGTMASLSSSWTSPADRAGPWTFLQLSCSQALPVWCVED